MKTYRHPTGDVRHVADDASKAQLAALEAQGYVLWDDAALQAKLEATEKAKQEAAQKLAAAQKEMAERYPGAAAEAERTGRKAPLNPAARGEIVTEGTILPVGEDKPPKSGTVVAEGTVEPQPSAPAVPKRKS